MRREKPSRASRKHAEVDESRLNPSIRGGLLLRLTLSLLPLANAALQYLSGPNLPARWVITLLLQIANFLT